MGDTTNPGKWRLRLRSVRARLLSQGEAAAILGLFAIIVELSVLLDQSPLKALVAIPIALLDGSQVPLNAMLVLSAAMACILGVRVYKRTMRRRAWTRFEALVRAAEAGDLAAFERAAGAQANQQFQKTIHRFAFDAARMRASLGASETMVMVADPEHRVTYANPQLIALFEEHLERFSQTFPDVTFPNVLGADIRLLNRGLGGGDADDDHVSGQIVAGGRRLQVRIDPIFDCSGKRLGTCAQWRDVTHELEVESEIDNIVDMIGMGELDMTMTISAADGVHRRVADGVNKLVAILGETLSSLNDLLAAVSTGDLSKRMDGDAMGKFGELAANANATVGKIADIVADIGGAARGLSEIVSALRRDAGALAERSIEAQSTVGRTAEAAARLTESIEQNAERAATASATAGAARVSAGRGGDIARDTAQAMSAIEASSRRVGDIASMIDEIAFQTNMLALNAAVEAARAGEAGRGFAVVAQEVRALSKRVADSARDIKNLLDVSTAEIHRGVSLAKRSGEALREIEDSVEGLAGLIVGVAETVSGQREAMAVMRDALGALDDAAARNVQLAADTAVAAERLGELSERLDGAVSFFGGTGAEAGGAAGRAGPGAALDQAVEAGPAAHAFADDLAAFEDDAALEAAALAAAGWTDARA